MRVNRTSDNRFQANLVTLILGLISLFLIGITLADAKETKKETAKVSKKVINRAPAVPTEKTQVANAPIDLSQINSKKAAPTPKVKASDSDSEFQKVLNSQRQKRKNQAQREDRREERRDDRRADRDDRRADRDDRRADRRDDRFRSAGKKFTNKMILNLIERQQILEERLAALESHDEHLGAEEISDAHGIPSTAEPQVQEVLIEDMPVDSFEGELTRKARHEQRAIIRKARQDRADIVRKSIHDEDRVRDRMKLRKRAIKRRHHIGEDAEFEDHWRF